MSFLHAVRTTLSPDLGIDLGTANTVIYERGTGVLVSEPSVVAYDLSGGVERVIAVGTAAKEMEGRAPSRIRVVHPLRGGTISDFQAAHILIETMVNRASAARPKLLPRVVACVPGCATDIECKAVEEAAAAAGARATTFLPQAVAAALGAGLDITTTSGKMVVDIGGGTTEIAVLALSGVVALHSVKVGGDYLDNAIITRLRHDRFQIGPLTAEALKIKLGYAGRPPGRAAMRVSGFDNAAGAPRAREVSEALVGEAHGGRHRSHHPCSVVGSRANTTGSRGGFTRKRYHADGRRRANYGTRRRTQFAYQCPHDRRTRSARVRCTWSG